MIEFEWDERKNESNRKKHGIMKAVKNPYASKKKAVGINLSAEVIDYFKGLSKEAGIPYQTLIDLYLRDCVKSKKKPKFEWAA